MSNYRTHTLVNLGVALPAFALAAAFWLKLPRPLLFTGMGTFIYGTLFMSPDLDLANKIKLFSLRGLLSIPFRTYALLFRHRGISHSFFLGTLTRLLWLGMYGLVIFYVLYEALPTQSTFLGFYKVYQPYILSGFAGLFLADTSHLIMDKLSST